MKVRCLLTALAFLAASAGLSAQTVVLPPVLAGSEGSAAYSLSTATTFQQVFDPGLLLGLPPGAVITGIQFRQEGGGATGPGAVMNFTNFNISVGPSAFAAGSLTSSVAANQGAGTIVVRSGALSLPANSFPGGSSPNAFGPVIAFQTGYTYTGGNLLFTISHTAASQVLNIDTDVGGVTGAQLRLEAAFNSSTVSSNFPDSAIPMQLTYSAVPEPTTIALIGLALGGGGLGGYRAWRGRRDEARAARLYRAKR